MKYNWKWSLGVSIFASQFALCLGDASEILPTAFAKTNDLVLKDCIKMRYPRNDNED